MKVTRCHGLMCHEIGVLWCVLTMKVRNKFRHEERFNSVSWFIGFLS